MPIDTLLTYTKSIISMVDIEQQMNLINTTNDPRPMSPILSMSVPILTTLVSNNDIITAGGSSIDIDKDLISFQESSEDSATTSRKIVPPSTMPLMTFAIEFEGNHQISIDSCDSSPSRTPLSKTSHEPKARFLSKETEVQDGFSETSIEITSESPRRHSKQSPRFFIWYLFLLDQPFDTIPDNAYDEIPPDGYRDRKRWNPGKNGIGRWSGERKLPLIVES